MCLKIHQIGNLNEIKYFRQYFRVYQLTQILHYHESQDIKTKNESGIR